jgi:mRNA interferase MazF
VVAQRGEIWWADFGQPFGSQSAYRRPALVIQADAFNRSSISTVLLIPLTRTIALAAAPGNVLCRPRDTGLPKPSVVNVSQLTVADRRRLIEKAGALPGRLLKQVEDGLRLVLEL